MLGGVTAMFSLICMSPGTAWLLAEPRSSGQANICLHDSGHRWWHLPLHYCACRCDTCLAQWLHRICSPSSSPYEWYGLRCVFEADMWNVLRLEVLPIGISAARRVNVLMRTAFAVVCMVFALKHLYTPHRSCSACFVCVRLMMCSGHFDWFQEGAPKKQTRNKLSKGFAIYNF